MVDTDLLEYVCLENERDSARINQSAAGRK
jgi:hypothetical protein